MAVSFPSFSNQSAITTVAPSLDALIAVARPMPRAPPVISITLSLSLSFAKYVESIGLMSFFFFQFVRKKNWFQCTLIELEMFLKSLLKKEN